MRYRDAGVDIARAEGIKEALSRAVRSTWNAGVVPLPSGFAGVLHWPGAGGAPALLAATLDGVGTKLHVALAAGRVSDAAADLVYHGANDLLVHGARPLALLDYVAQSRLDPDVVLEVVRGLARACVEVGAVLLGGETAEMPDTYLPGVVDVAGCMIGMLAGGDVLDGHEVKPGDVVLALAASGLHTNGYSLARRVLEGSGLGLDDPLPGGSGESIGEALLAPHRWYGRSVLPLIGEGRIRALAHVTGGGIAGNLVRVLPEGSRARIQASSWTPPALFRWLITTGGIPLEDARSAFNLGIGLLAVCRAADAASLAAALEAAGERVSVIGGIVAGKRGVEWIESS
jgi:phosphoribosylformylglycinamidine cyclo-ligase